MHYESLQRRIRFLDSTPPHFVRYRRSRWAFPCFYFWKQELLCPRTPHGNNFCFLSVSNQPWWRPWWKSDRNRQTYQLQNVSNHLYTLCPLYWSISRIWKLGLFIRSYRGCCQPRISCLCQWGFLGYKYCIQDHSHLCHY